MQATNFDKDEAQSEVEDVCNELEPKKFWKVAPIDEDANSCYYSASATDNYYSSTDEGGIHHHPIALHSSDSGADISEQQVEASPPAISGERNHSLSDVLAVDHDCGIAWEQFWSRNGESLIWSSWIEKYSDFIDPEFLEKQRKNSGTAELDAEVAAAAANKPLVEMSIVVSSATPNPPHEGWNPLSPNTSDADPWQSHRITEADNLLSPRCDSVTLSIPGTHTDSMTNVTRMTNDEQYDDFCSSKVTSESSSISSSVSSVSASANRCESAEGMLLNDDSMDADQYWQVLWQEHFQQQFAMHYKKFVDAHEALKDEGSCSSLKSDGGFPRIKRHHHHGTRNRTIRRKRGNGKRFENITGLISGK